LTQCKSVAALIPIAKKEWKNDQEPVI